MTSPSDLSLSPNSFSSLEESLSGRSSSGLSFDRSFDIRDRLLSRIDQLRSVVFETAESLTVSPQQHRKEVDALSRGQQLIRSPSVKVLTDFIPIREKQSPYDDSIEKGEVEKKVQKFCEHEAIAERLKQVSSVVDVLDAFEGFRALPAKVGLVAREIFDGKQIAFDSKKPAKINYDQQLGAGGQGIVCRGSFFEDSSAVKVSKEDNIQEYNMLTRFDHPRIISAFAATKNTIHLPLAIGDLKTAWQAKNLEDRLTPLQLRTFLKQIAEGMAYLHKEGFVHRDLKPANILIKENGDIVIADLGLVESVQNIGSITQRSNQMLQGTMQYMAPETYPQRELCEQVSVENCTKRDVWALGIMIWQLLSKGDKYHPCQADRLKTDKPIHPDVFGLFKNVMEKKNDGWFQPGELEAQLDPEKVRHYDPQGYIVELMKACLILNPNDRISMEEVQGFLEIAPTVDQALFKKLSKSGVLD